MYKDKDLEWIREMYSKHNILVVKLSGKWFAKMLHKLRRPQKHDAVNDAMHVLLDTYIRMYVDGQPFAEKRKKRRKSVA